MPFAPIDEAVAAIARGEFVVVVDDADRENEGDLIIAAERITPEGIAFMVRHTSGVICLPVVGARLDELRIPLMVADNTESQRTAFTVSVDAKAGTSTGISAADAEARIPSPFGDFTAYAYQSMIDGTEHIALVRGEVAGAENVLVRVHSECLTGDVFSSLRCDCGTQLMLAQQRIAEEGRGAIVYLRCHHGRGIGIAHKLRAYQLQEQGRDTVEANLELGFAADSREYGIGAQILVDLGITTMRLMTNNPAKYGGLAGYNLEIVERVGLQSIPNVENIAYLRAKAAKLGHHLVFDTDAEALADLAAESSGASAAAPKGNGNKPKDPDDADV